MATDIVQGHPADRLDTQGMRPLAVDGKRLVAAGLTSADEVARVCSLGLS